MEKTVLIVLLVMLVIWTVLMAAYAIFLFWQWKKDRARRDAEEGSVGSGGSNVSEWNHIRLLEMRRRLMNQPEPAPESVPEPEPVAGPAVEPGPAPVPDPHPGINLANIAAYERHRKVSRHTRKVQSFEAATNSWIERRNQPGFVPQRQGRYNPVARPPSVQPIPEESHDVSRSTSSSSKSSKL